jgi:mRNA interferase MazF
MKPGDVILTPVPQADGRIKIRPAIILCKMPPYNDLLVCGISTQLHQYVNNFDEIISPGHKDYISSGLLGKSLIRLGFLALLPISRIMGTIGSISPDRHNRLLKSLSDYLIHSTVI